MSEELSDRRAFLGGSAAVLGYFFTADALSATRAAETPSETIRFAGIGVGGKGQSDILNAARVGHVVALCDIDEGKMDQTLNFKDKKSKEPQPPLSDSKPKLYSDFRKMFDEIGKEIDAVTVSTADHSHAIASITAMRMKKHVYCQKPLCHSVWEARLMRETAKQHGVCTQMGNQGSAENGLRRAIELVQDGLLGKIKEIHVWTNRPIWPQGADAILKVGAAKAAAYGALHGKAVPFPAPVAPKGINWDVFLGPAPERPYDGAYHPFAWRGWWDFGTGALGDMACHTANMAFRACELGSPTTIEADATDVNPETCPTSAKIKYTYPARGDKPHQAALDFYWYEGVRAQRKVVPPRELLAKLLKPGDNLSDSGSIIVGDKAILFSPNDYGAQFKIVGEVELPKNLDKPERLPATETRNKDLAMKEEWARAIRENKPEIAFSNFEIAGMLTEAILLGNVAIRAQKKLEFDAAKLQCPNVPQASQYIKREYRKGWELSERA